MHKTANKFRIDLSFLPEQITHVFSEAFLQLTPSHFFVAKNFTLRLMFIINLGSYNFYKKETIEYSLSIFMIYFFQLRLSRQVVAIDVWPQSFFP